MTRPERRLVVVAFLLVASTVTWRRGAYYSGGVDPVVAIKAILDLVALGLAVRSARRAEVRYRLSSVSAWFLGLILIASMFGAAYTQTTLTSSLVLCVRQVILAVTVYQLLRAFPVLQVLRALVIAMAVTVAVSAITGIGSLASGRLSGGIPPLNPNEMTGLCGVVILALAWRNMEHLGRRWDLPIILVMTGLIWASGSRTGLLALVIALAVLFLQARRLPAGVVMALLAAVPLLFYLAAGTNLISNYLNRGGSQNVTSLNQRTVAWSAALHLHTAFWDTWFGNGLSMVKIPVTAQFRTEQILDSSWMSALVQSGVVGVVLLGLWILSALSVAIRSPRHYRLLATALLGFVVSRSILESGLIGATPVFLIFFLVSIRQGNPVESRPASADWHSSAVVRRESRV
jgi:O-antigen ligase/polysaccharide polymerase Wzy-like membrane protein